MIPRVHTASKPLSWIPIQVTTTSHPSRPEMGHSSQRRGFIVMVLEERVDRL